MRAPSATSGIPVSILTPRPRYNGPWTSDTAEGLLVRLATLDQAVQAFVPTSLHLDMLSLQHDPARAGHPRVTKMYTSMRWAYNWEAMIADLDAFVAGCATCAKSKVQGLRRTAPVKVFPAQEPFANVRRDLLGPSPVSARGDRYILVIVRRFTKLVRAVPIPRDDAETVVAAFFDGCLTRYGPFDTPLMDNGPQRSSSFVRGGWKMMGIQNLTPRTYHPQTQGQVEHAIRP